MEYRKLGKSGLKISQFSFGSWVTFSNQVDVKSATEMMSACRDFGINFFDNAEIYANGRSEEVMGEVFQKLGWSRLSYLVSTKLFWGIEDGVNSRNTLNRKYLLESIRGCLRRLRLEHVDLLYCHRPDPETPIAETVWAMHDMIQRGYALYWGTSEWSANEIKQAIEVADRHHLHRPIVEQPQYNLTHRHRVESEYASLYDTVGLGLTTWSPLASGVLTGKYLNGIPEGSRASFKSLSWLAEMANEAQTKERVKKYVTLAKELNVSPANLAIAWCTKNPRVSSVILGASNMDQLKENLKSIQVASVLTKEVLTKLEQIFPL